MEMAEQYLYLYLYMFNQQSAKHNCSRQHSNCFSIIFKKKNDDISYELSAYHMK